MPGRVFKRGDVYWVAFSLNGKEYRKSAKTEKKREAETVLSFYLGQCARGECKGFVEATPTYTLNEMLDDFLEDYQQRGMRDVQNTRYRSKHLRGFFGDKAAGDIDERQVDLYIKHRLKQGKKHATVNRDLSLLLSSFRLAKRKKLLKDVPHIPMFPENNARQGFFEREELERILAFLPDYVKDVVRLAYCTG